MNLCIFFTNLALHFSIFAHIRNGLCISKFSLYNSDEMSNPGAWFWLGIAIILVNVMCAIVNMQEGLF